MSFSPMGPGIRARVKGLAREGACGLEGGKSSWGGGWEQNQC